LASLANVTTNAPGLIISANATGHANDSATYDAPLALARESAAFLAEASGIDRVDAYVVLGSGWGGSEGALGEVLFEIATGDVPGFSAPVVLGHGGTLRIVRAGANIVLAQAGRTHLYEGRGVDAVVHGVRTAAACGARTIVLTNGSGGLVAEWGAAIPVIISDHINLTGASPLKGPDFIDLTNIYTPALRDLMRDIDPTLHEGVYIQLTGPQYETAAEVRMLQTLGAHMTGMSTAVEAIEARRQGLDVLGLSFITNPGAGLSGEPLDHHEVLAAGAAAAPRLGALLGEALARLPKANA